MAASKKRKSSSSRRTRPQPPVPAEAQADLAERFGHFLGERLGRLLLFLILVLLLIGLDLVISGDALGTFSLLCGVELLVAIILAWIRFFYQRRREGENNEYEN